MHIVIIIGTRAELIKTFPIMLELKKRKINYSFVHTGQHELDELCDIFGVKRPDVVLSTPPKKTTKFWGRTIKAIFWLATLLPKIWIAVRKLKPDFVIYHGDTMTTAGAAVATSKFLNPFKKWKNVHLEAGLRSHSLFEPFPEEISRRITTLFSDILFAPSEVAMRNLDSRKNVFNVGNTVVDSINIALKKAHKPNLPKKYVLLTVHRHENIKSRQRMEKIVEILSFVEKDIYWPMHDNTKKKLKEYGLLQKLKKMRNLHLMKLKSYIEFAGLLKNCDYVITDGGSIQEESLALKKPCIILRKKTERIEGLGTGINFLTGLDVEKTKNIIKKLERTKIKHLKFKNPYGEKGVSKKIIDLLLSVS